MDTLRRRSGRRVTVTLLTRVRGGRAKSRQGCRERALEGRNPREHPAVDVLNPRPVARDSREGQSPGTAARWAGPSRFVGAGIPTGKTVCGFIHRGNAADTFCEEKAPKGKSQERCRCETKPARAQRE
jgi:hypothetical protein